MQKRAYILTVLISLAMVFVTGCTSVEVSYDKNIPQLAFAAQELKLAIKQSKRKGLQVSFVVKPDGSESEAFQIRYLDPDHLEITGSDATGAMYGGLEVADLLRLGLPVEDQDYTPFIRKRGIKINIPLDARTPSYDDTGDAAQKNIETMWDFEFWKAYLDDLARYRYNVLSLWATHPYPHMIKMEEYPDVAMDDVYRVSDGILTPDHSNKFQDLDFDKPGTIELVKKMSIEEKIAHWQRVFQYAEDRGIEIFLFHWNVFTFNATGKYGITQEQENPHTVEYLRKCVKQVLLTYPQITGIGLCVGENNDRYVGGEHESEYFAFNTYGRAIMDVKEQQPERDIRLIMRRHNAEYPKVSDAFKDYTGGVLEGSLKYAVAHMYSSRRPQEWEDKIVDEGWLKEYKIWLNLRNDDITMHRWGSPDFAREFIKWMPHEHMPGFYMGSDAYVWGREFISKNPEMAGRLEIDKHWYRYRLWGQLAYNPELGREYWEAVLQHRFPGVDARLLYDTWESTSEIIPQINRSVWAPNDGAFNAAGCMYGSGFLTVDLYNFARPPMVLNRIENAPDPQCISATDWAKAYLAGTEPEGLTPLQIAENLDGYAAVALEALPTLREQMGDNAELKETLYDIESMAYLGRYYADKMRGAAKLAVFRESGRQEKQFHEEAVAHLEDAVDEWKAYASILTPQYKTQLMARPHYMDWNSTLKEVEKEVVTVRQQGDFPELRFANLEDGESTQAGSELRVELEATDGDGIKQVKLYLNGQVLNPGIKTDDTYVWNASGDELLTSLNTGIYDLEALAEDNNGIKTRESIRITAGNVSPNSKPGWQDEIYDVILNEGERLMDGEIRDVPRLECFLTLHEDGRLSLVSGTPEKREGSIWNAAGKANRPTPQPVPYRFYALLENGQLVIYREKPGPPRLKIFATPEVSAPGPYKLGITASQKLVVFRGEGEKTEIVWMSNN
jgi:hypothetical protein